MGYYLPSKSYLRPKPQTKYRQRLITLSAGGLFLVIAGAIFLWMQFGDYKSSFANIQKGKTDNIDMPVVLMNNNFATAENVRDYDPEFPVILAYFKTTKSNRNVELKWSTMQEYKNDCFTVQKSTNGTTFKTIGCVDSKKSNTYSSDYSFLDDSISEGSIYYRLLQTSENGKSTFIALEKVANKNDNSDLALYIQEVGPLPFDNFFNVNYYSDRPCGVSVELFDKSGRKIYKTYTEAQQGYNMCRFIDGVSLLDNEYTLRIANSRGAFVKRIKKKI